MKLINTLLIKRKRNDIYIIVDKLHIHKHKHYLILISINKYILIIANHMILLLPTTKITLIPTPCDLFIYPIKINILFTFKLHGSYVYIILIATITIYIISSYIHIQLI